MVIDSISNLIVNLKNAGVSGRQYVVSPFSNFNFAVLELLQKEGYIHSVSKKGKKTGKYIEVEVAYEDGKSKITGVKRLSTFSKRMYQSVSEIKPVKSGQGILVLSTPKGILTDKEAKKAKVGGEALFKIW